MDPEKSQVELTLEAISAAASEAASNAVLAGMEKLKAEQESAENHKAADDPLVTEAIEKRVDEMVTERVKAAEAKWQLERDRAIAEDSMVQVGGAKAAVEDCFPHIKTIAEKPASRLTEVEKDACALHDALYVIQVRAKKPEEASRLYLRSQGLSDTAIEKALDSYTSTTGYEWVNQVFSNQFVSRIALGGKILPLFPRFVMPAKIVTVPRSYGRATAYRQSSSENTSLTADTTALSTNITFTAEDINLYQAYSDNLDSDAIPSLLPLLTAEFSAAISEWLDICIVDGCDSADMDSDWSATTDPRYCWDGLRYRASQTTTANTDLSTFSWDNLVTIPSLMAGYNSDPEKLSWLVPTKTYWAKLMTLKDSQNNPVWLPATGPTGINPVVNGQIGWLGGIPVTASGVMKTNLNASGVYDGSTTSKAALICVYRDAWWFGDRQQITVETQHMVAKRNTDCVMTVRADFQHMYSTDVTTAIGYNF